MWKDIIGFEGIYKLNEYGDVFSLKSNKILTPYISNKGYKIIDLYNGKARTKMTIHKLVAIHFVPNPDNLPIVLHADNNKLNTYYTNLKWGTYSENNSQAIRDGLNQIPRPDNRKKYEVYNNNSFDRVICNGAKEVSELIGYGSDSVIRNLIFRKDLVKQGEFKGFGVRKLIPMSPLDIPIQSPIVYQVDVQRSALCEGGESLNVDP